MIPLRAKGPTLLDLETVNWRAFSSQRGVGLFKRGDRFLLALVRRKESQWRVEKDKAWQFRGEPDPERMSEEARGWWMVLVGPC